MTKRFTLLEAMHGLAEIPAGRVEVMVKTLHGKPWKLRLISRSEVLVTFLEGDSLMIHEGNSLLNSRILSSSLRKPCLGRPTIVYFDVNF